MNLPRTFAERRAGGSCLSMGLATRGASSSRRDFEFLGWMLGAQFYGYFRYWFVTEPRSSRGRF